MTSIADSSAIFDPSRVLAQHQVALTLIKAKVEDPSLSDFRWLDLACGRGQILVNLSQVMSPPHRQKIRYVGIDVEQGHTREATRLAQDLFGEPRFEICDLHRFADLLGADARFDFITFTNTAHEIAPRELAQTLTAALYSLASQGQMFMYDMETLPFPELGAIPWKGKEFERIVRNLLVSAGAKNGYPEAATWPHKSCSSWHILLQRAHIKCDDATLHSNRDNMISGAEAIVQEIMMQKLVDVTSALDSLRKYGPQNEKEKAGISHLLHDHFALSRALKAAHFMKGYDG